MRQPPCDFSHPTRLFLPSALSFPGEVLRTHFLCLAPFSLRPRKTGLSYRPCDYTIVTDFFVSYPCDLRPKQLSALNPA